MNNKYWVKEFNKLKAEYSNALTEYKLAVIAGLETADSLAIKIEDLYLQINAISQLTGNRPISIDFLIE